MSMHLVILTPGFPEDEEDSSCIPPLQEFVRALDKSQPDWKISVISFQYPYQKDSYLWNGIQVFCARGENKKGWKKIQTWRRAWQYFSRLHKAFPVSIIHSFWLGECAMLGEYVSRSRRIPHICTLMGQDARPGNKYFKLRLKPEQLVCLSVFHQQQLYQSSGIKSSHLIRWGIDPEQFPNTNHERDIDLLGVGSLIPGKNYLEFLKIVLNLRHKYPNLKACIIGDGPQKEELETYIQQNQLERQIRLPGKMSRATVFQYMNRSKVLLHTSEYESFSMVIVEALQMGAYICCKTPVGIIHPLEKWDEIQEKIVKPEDLADRLNRQFGYHPVSVPTLQQNVQAYVRLYQSSLS